MVLLGLLSGAERKNSWTIAEQAGDLSPEGMQRLFNHYRWDADAVRDYVLDQFGHPAGRGRRDNIMRQAQDCDPDDPFAQGLLQTYSDLETERRATLAAVAELDAAEQAAPARPTADNARLLDALPYLRLNLPEAPEDLLRGLIETAR